MADPYERREPVHKSSVAEELQAKIDALQERVDALETQIADLQAQNRSIFFKVGESS